jgi:hypothetical protein
MMHVSACCLQLLDVLMERQVRGRSKEGLQFITHQASHDRHKSAFRSLTDFVESSFIRFGVKPITTAIYVVQ